MGPNACSSHYCFLVVPTPTLTPPRGPEGLAMKEFRIRSLERPWIALSETISDSLLNLNSKWMTNNAVTSGSHKVVVIRKGKENKGTNPKRKGGRRIKWIILNRGACQWKTHLIGTKIKIKTYLLGTRFAILSSLATGRCRKLVS